MWNSSGSIHPYHEGGFFGLSTGREPLLQESGFPWYSLFFLGQTVWVQGPPLPVMTACVQGPVLSLLYNDGCQPSSSPEHWIRGLCPPSTRRSSKQVSDRQYPAPHLGNHSPERYAAVITHGYTPLPAVGVRAQLAHAPLALVS